jgi:hypothetical protein
MSGRDAGSTGIDPERIAELLVELHGQEPGRRGSGYRVSVSAVLTAAHVVQNASRVRVRFNADRPGEWMTQGAVAWLDPTADAAVVTITPRPEDEGQVIPVAFGRVAERDAVLACSAMGFPRFKLRNDPDQPLDDGNPSQYRDSVHAVGTIAVLSNRRQGTLEVSVSPPERNPDPQRSPWEGMSGAAVWSGGRIIGLVAEHHRADGLGRLAAVRVDRWYEDLAGEQFDQLRTLLPGMPARASGLVEVVPPTPGELLAAGYIAQVRDIAPEQLVGRQEELAELVQFCAGEERYGWWQAEPWAGKSALAAWFVLHPPAGVSIVSFFVTGRLAGQADSDAFTEAMIEQLAAVAGEPIAAIATPAGRDRERRRLLDRAAARVGEQGGRLLLLVDGLDEDEGLKLPGGKPSIASLLPKRPPDPVRVLVFSRPSPGVPGDVSGDHPLRHCAVQQLAAWSSAQDVRLQAKQELLEQLHGDQLQVDVISFITAAGGGLTLLELAELTSQPQWTLDGKLGSAFGRSLYTRSLVDRSSEDAADRVYLFAHETLRAIAEQQLAHDLGPYRQRIDAWADTYRAQGWPDTTPRYLLRPYGRLLATRADLDRLVGLATDTARHHRMLAHTYGDAAALAEIATTQQLILAQPIPDPVVMGLLAVHKDHLANRNRAVPAALPALWVHLGQSHRAEAIARSITDPVAEVRALCAVAKALTQADRYRSLALIADAQEVSREITDSEGRAWALASIAEALAEAGQWERAEETAGRINRPEAQVSALATLARSMANKDRDRARRVAAQAQKTARRIGDPNAQIQAFIPIVEALAEAGEWRRAEQAVLSLRDLEARTLALQVVTSIIAKARPWYSTRQAVANLTDRQVKVLGNRIKVLVQTGQWDRAERTVQRITDPSARAEALAALAAAMAKADRDWAVALATAAEQSARSITDLNVQTRTLVAVAEELVEFDQNLAATLALDVEQIARTITDPTAKARVLGTMAEALADIGQWDRAQQVAQSITDATVKAQVLSGLAKGLAEVDQDRALALAANADQMARSIANHDAKAQVLIAVAQALAKTVHSNRTPQTTQSITDPDARIAANALAKALTVNAEKIAHGIRSTGYPFYKAEAFQTTALATVVKALTEAGQWEIAKQIARSIRRDDAKAQVLTALTKALTEAGQWDHAEQTARSISGNWPSEYEAFQATALATVAEALIEARQWERATKITRSISDRDAKAQVLTALTKALTEAGQWEYAKQIARSITGCPRYQAEAFRATALATVAKALIEAGQWHRARQIVYSIRHDDAKAQVLTALAKSLAEIDRDRALALAADAEEIAHSIADRDLRIRALTSVVEALAQVREWDRAERIARSVTGNWSLQVEDYQATALAMVAKALIEAGEWDRAEQIAHMIPSDDIQAEVLIALAKALTKAGDCERAEQTAYTVTGYWSRNVEAYRSMALTTVAKALIEAGEWDSTEQIARSISDRDAKAQVLTALTKALTEAGQWERAEQIAHGITDPNAQIKTYLLIAETLTTTSTADRAGRDQLLEGRACRILADILAGDYWLQAIQPLAKRSASGLLAIDEAIRTLNS